MLNITGTATNDDPSFRYKMPKLVSKIEGRGNGIKTVIVNLADIAESINRPASLPTKFFGCELGAQTRWEEDAQKATVNGAHQAPDLQKLLNMFIDKFVLCPNCHLPETALVVRKGLIKHKCSACGAKEPVDMSHKLCTFILKEATAASAAAQGTKEDKKARKAAKKAAGEAAGDDKKKEKKEKKEKKASADGDAGEDGSSSDEEAGAPANGTGASTSAPAPISTGVQWHTDLSKEAVEARRVAEAARVAGPSSLASPTASAAHGGFGYAPNGPSSHSKEGDDDEDEVDGSVVEAIRAEVVAASPPASVESAVASVIKNATNAALPPSDRASLYLRAVLGGSAPVAAIAALRETRHVAVLKALLRGAAGKPSQAALLYRLEGLLAKEDVLLKATPVLLKFLYDSDVLEEEAIVAWFATKGGRQDVRAKAKPFVEWLAAAEEEDEDEE